MSDYTFELVNSKTMAKIGELTQARGRQLSLAHNKAGSFEMRLPLRDSFSDRVQQIATGVMVKRLGVPKWSGPVWTVNKTVDNQGVPSLAVGCVGWLQTLEKRLVYPLGSLMHAAWIKNQYVDEDAGSIALDLLGQSNNDNAFSDTNYVVPGDYESSQQRTRTYQPWSSVLGEITALSEIESGYDMLVDPATRELDIYQRIGSVRPEVMFELGKNVVSVNMTSDASRMCNRMIAYSSIGWAQADDLVSQAAYGVFEEAVSLTDVRDVAILQAYANGEIAVRSTPLEFYGFQPRRFSSANSDDPRIFRDFAISDTAYLRARAGSIDVPRQAVRVFGATIAFDDDTGAEQLTSLQTTFTSGG